MNQSKPYLSFSPPGISTRSRVVKTGAEKNEKAMREKTIGERRQTRLLLADMIPAPASFRFEPGICADVPCERVVREGVRGDRVVVYLHGGGWATGCLRTTRAAAAMICEASGCAVLVPEYRLAPEFPFPAALDDCAAVYRRLLDCGFSGRTALFGDSAGGNLSLALIHRLKTEALPLPVCAGLASPCPDLSETCGLTKSDFVFTWHEGREQSLLDLYCGEYDRQDPLLSPMFGDLTGFPPMLIHAGQDEALYPDCDRFAQKAFDAGAVVSLKVWREMFHDFTIVGKALKESRLSMKEFGAFFREHLLPEPAGGLPESDELLQIFH